MHNITVAILAQVLMALHGNAGLVTLPEDFLDEVLAHVKFWHALRFVAAHRHFANLRDEVVLRWRKETFFRGLPFFLLYRRVHTRGNLYRWRYAIDISRVERNEPLEGSLSLTHSYAAVVAAFYTDHMQYRDSLTYYSQAAVVDSDSD